ncbi:mitochondrial import inner membrane translocase subunit tim23 [Sporothrix schenckii 1099-18]|uniref:Mitochondrial import inner membrane translocase subunit tim23 n=1 Tax=Sporothrix schenckii 1099-18 TaxID=1397361 RepID=A0A0F2M0M1_SPOSC|nr:mitochondrial import inner membrane translocase subunit tim23 [Sporothrix schenckii 1099-18]KJR83263.1 mitochondrial import inner membrane translocase subunit tim23 [Sporothrix schenckii 1099-18]
MSIWGALTGRKSSSTSEPNHADSRSSSSSSSIPAHTVYDSPAPAGAPSGGNAALATLGSGGADSFLQSSTFADPTQLHPLAGLNKETLEYISMEDSTLSDLPGSQSVLPSRGFTDDLCYGTGITYLTALSLGGAWGLQEGLRRSAGQPPKLRLNSVLNAVTRRGPFLGNSAGVVAICYNCINSYIGYLRGRHDAFNSVLAGGLSGMLFKSTRGVRPMMISGGIVASVAAAWTVTRRTFFPIPEPHSAH